MTIDEAIAQEREKAKLHRDSIVPKDRYNNMPWIDSANKSHTYYAEQHEQLAEWLEELKAYRASTFSGDITQAMLKEERNKAIYDFAKWLESKKYLMKEIHEHYLCYTHYDEIQANNVIIEYLDEQLKAGGAE